MSETPNIDATQDADTTRKASALRIDHKRIHAIDLAARIDLAWHTDAALYAELVDLGYAWNGSAWESEGEEPR